MTDPAATVVSDPASDGASTTMQVPSYPGGDQLREVRHDGTGANRSPRTCLVTGATSGIGEAVARRLAAEGNRVAITGRRADRLDALAAEIRGDADSATGQQGAVEVLAVPGDVTLGDDIERVFAEVEHTWGAVEVLVLSAGAGISAPVQTTTDDDWQRMLDLNLTAPFRCMRRALPQMVESGFGRIIVIASIAAKVGEPLISAYTASKHGVLGLVRAAAAETARTGVTVNAVCPAYVDTPMTDATVADISARTGRTPAEARAVLERKQPIRRLIAPTEVADAVLLCVASGAITGQGINVDGGAVQS